MRTRKFKKPRLPHKVFLVICEGETEGEYVNALKKHFRLPVTIKTRICGNAINRRLVKQYIDELGVSSDDDYRIFYIYDCDIQCIVDKIKSLPGDIILTNPCIELWFLLHNIDFQRCQDSKSIVKELTRCHSAWASYTKGSLSKDQNDILINNRAKAAARSKRLNWPENPSSNMHILLEALESRKSAK